MHKVMLQTVGTGRRVYDAITKSIYEANPTFVYFFCSEGSEKTLDEVLERVIEEKILGDDQYEMVPVKDINDHNDVFQQVVTIVDNEKTKGLKDNQFVVDYTSGTKAMSVGLALGASAAIPGSSFRYVGSKIRDKQYGRVFSGEEDIKIRRSPSYYLGYEDERQIKFLFDKHSFRSASELIDDVLSRNPSMKLRRRLEKFKPVCEWLDAWDHFDYVKARDIAFQLEPDNLSSFNLDGQLLTEKQSFLETLCKQSYIHDDQQEAVPSHEIICDLYRNTHRRLNQNLRMDAWLRTKRFHLMIVQFMLMTKFGLDPVFPQSKVVLRYLRDEHSDHSALIREEPLNLLTAAQLLEKIDSDVPQVLLEGLGEEESSSPVLGRGFHPAPQLDAIREQLEQLREVFEEYSYVLQTEEDVSVIMNQAKFPQLP